MNDDIDDDPTAAAALFERTAPDLAEPRSVVLESGPPYDVARWTVRTATAVYRMKVAVEPAAKARLDWGARVLTAMDGTGPPAPTVARVHKGGGKDGVETPFVVVETRVGATDAATQWDRLAKTSRVALAEPLAKALSAVHAVPLDRLAWRGAPPATPWRDAVRLGAERRLAALRPSGTLPPDLLNRVRTRLEFALEAMPKDVPRRLCHGHVRPSSVALERGAFAGLRDFEEARAADPLTDAALWMLSTGDPAGEPARRLLAALASATGPRSELATRVDAYLGLEILRCLSDAVDADSPEGVEGLTEAVEAWVGDAFLPPP